MSIRACAVVDRSIESPADKIWHFQSLGQPEVAVMASWNRDDTSR